MANFTELLGFFTLVGSTDHPKNWKPDDNFGFDDDGTGPIFDCSYSDLLNAFDSPIENKKVSSFDLGGIIDDISNLVLEDPNVDNFIVDPGKNHWADVYRILEYLAINQDNATVARFNTEMVTESKVLNYIPDTMILSKNSTYNTRINYVIFEVNFAADGEPVDSVKFKIYFYPDEFITNESNNRYRVYRYEDLDGNNLISDDEFKTQIIERKMDIFKSGRYKYYKVLSTNFKEGDVYTKHIFYVYTIVDDMDATDVENAVIEHLTKKYDYKYNLDHYPDLFGGSSVNIIPVNNRDITNSFFVSSISYSKWTDVLVKNNVNPNDQNFKNAEIIHVGNEDDGYSNPCPMPLIVYDSEILTSTPPILSVYPEHIARYVPFVGYGNEVDGNRPLTFHHLLFISTLIACNLTTENDPRVTEIPEEYLFEIVKSAEGVIVSVGFKILGIRYNVLAITSN